MNCTKYIHSSIGRKQLSAITGLLLVFFLIGHLAGNFLIFAGYGDYNHEQAKIISGSSDEIKADLSKTNGKATSNAPKLDVAANTDTDTIPINAYAKKLKSMGPLLWIARAGLLFIFFFHMSMSMQAVMANKAARPTAYSVSKSKGALTLAGITMRFTGPLIFLYVLVHLADFTLHFLPNTDEIDGVSEGLYGLVVNRFANPLYTGFYTLCMCVLGLHLSHGIPSAAQTLGLNHPSYTPKIKKFGKCLGILIALGFISIPVVVFIQHTFIK